MNLENLGVQEMNAKELVGIDGGAWFNWQFIENTLSDVGNSIVDAGQWTLGVLAGMGDGITDGLND